MNNDKDIREGYARYLEARQRIADCDRALAQVGDLNEDLNDDLDNDLDAPLNTALDHLKNAKTHLHSVLGGEVVRLNDKGKDVVLIPKKKGGVVIRSIARRVF
jgi:hypothetical protein